ncbi:MAG: MgtC/SapB family protein [Planctomycetota bacterium]
MPDLIQAFTPELGFLIVGFRLGLALALGGLLGLDRERLHKAAGVRTMALVSVGAASFMILAEELMLQARLGESIDGGRMPAAVITGVALLGGAAIIRAGGNSHGLTTAAGIWIAACVGLAAGAGSYGLAVMAFGASVLVLIALGSAKKALTRIEEGDDVVDGYSG